MGSIGNLLTQQSESRWGTTMDEMRTNFTVNIEASLHEMVDKMTSAGMGSQVVMSANGEEILGVVTERDYLLKVAALREPVTCVEDIMTPISDVTPLHETS